MEFLWTQCFPYYNKDIPKKVRRVAWKYRLGYAVLNGILLFWILGLSNTCLWIKPLHYLAPEDADPDASQFVQFSLVLGLSWISYILVQGSNPGFVDKDMLRRAGFDPDTGTTSGSSSLQEDTVSLTTSLETKVEVEMTNMTSSTESKQKNSHEGERTSLLDDMEGLEHEGDTEECQNLVDQVRAQYKQGLSHLPLRCRWCKRNERYVAKYDHYCLVLGTCIGERNHCRFWWYLMSQTLALGWAVSVVLTGIEYRLNWGTWFSANLNKLFCALVLWCLLFLVLSLLGFHSFLAASNMTSYELRKGSKIDYMADFDECDLPFSNGLCHNLRLFCCVSSGFSNSSNGVMDGDDLEFSRTRTRRKEQFSSSASTWAPIIWSPPQKFNRNSRDCCNNIWENKYWRCC